jgi:hypothetical protein
MVACREIAASHPFSHMPAGRAPHAHALPHTLPARGARWDPGPILTHRRRSSGSITLVPPGANHRARRAHHVGPVGAPVQAGRSARQNTHPPTPLAGLPPASRRAGSRRSGASIARKLRRGPVRSTPPFGVYLSSYSPFRPIFNLRRSWGSPRRAPGVDALRRATSMSRGPPFVPARWIPAADRRHIRPRLRSRWSAVIGCDADGPTSDATGECS